MKQKQESNQQSPRRPKLRIVTPEEVAGLPKKPMEAPRNRCRLTQQLSQYCDQIDQEIERLMRL